MSKTKLKEFLSSKSKRKYTPLNYRYETHTVTGVAINRNGKPINRVQIMSNDEEPATKKSWLMQIFKFFKLWIN